MKTIYTAISLALLAAVAQAEPRTLPSRHRQSRDLGYGDTDGGHDFLGESLETGDVVGDTFDHDFLGNGYNHPKHQSEDDSDDDVVPSFDNGVADVGFSSAPVNSPSGGPHNFNQQGGPDTDSGHNEVDDGVNNDNIVITPVIAQQQAQANEQDVNVAPPHDGPPHVEHQPEQLPPQQHSEPKQTTTEAPEPEEAPVEHPESNQVAYKAPAAPAQAPAPTSAPAPAPAHAPAPAPAPAQSHSQPTPERGGEVEEQEPPCPESEDGTHHMPMGDDTDDFEPTEEKHEPKPEAHAEHPSTSKGISYQPPQPPQPPYVPQPYPLPHNAPKPDSDDYDNDDDLESFPAPEVVHPQPTPASYPQPEAEVYKPFPPGRQYEKPQPQVTPQSSLRAKTSPAPSSVRYASYQAPAHSEVPKHTTPCTWTTTPGARVHQTPTPTVPSPLAAPSAFLGGAGFLAVPQGFILAMLGALAFLL